MVRDILTLILLTLIVTLPLSMYKYTYDQRIKNTYELLNDMMVNDTTSSVDIWGSEVIVESGEFHTVYTSLGPDRQINTNDDIKLICSKH